MRGATALAVSFLPVLTKGTDFKDYKTIEELAANFLFIQKEQITYEEIE